MGESGEERGSNAMSTAAGRNQAALGEENITPEESEAQSEEHRADANIVSWSGLDDPKNPVNWSSLKRWTLITLVSAVTLVAGLSSSIRKQDRYPFAHTARPTFLG